MTPFGARRRDAAFARVDASSNSRCVVARAAFARVDAL
jgi:hypothetical protein|tara:strand:- start:1818 stop:1931 length:114 start_codon:yes stop_codon:yes gene_type:complete